MDTNWPANLHDLAITAYEVFVLPGNYLLSQLLVHTPELALRLGIGVEQNGAVLPAIVAFVAWSLSGFLAWKAITTIGAHICYGTRRVRTFLVSRLQARKRHRVLSEPVPVPEVELDDLDLAVLDMGSTLPPGLALTAAELSGQLTTRPAEVQQSLDKLRSYGLVDDAIGSTDGYDNYCLTRSGAALLSMWQRQLRVLH